MQLPTSDPIGLYRLRDGLQAVDLLAAAIAEFDLFTRLRGCRPTLEELCAMFGFAERPADVLVSLARALGLLDETGGRYTLTRLAEEFLVAGSPWFAGPYYAAMKGRPVCQDYVRVLRTGKPANWGSLKDSKDWVASMADDAFADTFTAAMDCRGAYLAPALAQSVDIGRRSRLLDVAGGSGIYACTWASMIPGLEATVLEKPPVDQVAERHVRRRGMESRVSVAAMDMFDMALPGGHDIHLISNVLHDWDVGPCRRLLAASASALPVGGMVVVHDAFLNREKSGPLPVAMYSALLMHCTEGRCYSVGEMEEWLLEAGFSHVDFRETTLDRGRITAIKGG